MSPCTFYLFTHLVGSPLVPGIIVGCDANDDCPEYTSCRNRKCINPCAVDKPCAPTANCRVVDHNPVCTCPNGYIGTPQTKCTLRESWIRPWRYYFEIGIVHWSWNWFSWYFSIFSAPQPECTRNEECPLTLACINQECKDPCFKHVCGINADCKVKRHRPICFCLPGFVGNPDQICEERKANLYGVIRNVSMFKCMLFHFSAGCKSDSECPLTQACINRECQDPCIYERCGTNAQCVVQNHRASCICPPDYRGNPYEFCRRPECITDPDCPTTLACRNEKCVDPCECARHAYCSARNHRGICTCEPGYTGDPYGIACT